MSPDGRLLAGKHLLIVEDEILVALPLLDELPDMPARVTGSIGSVSKALQALDSETFDAAILEVNLGGELVWPVAERLAASGVPFVFVTGYVDDHSFPPPFRDVPRVNKPASPDEILTALEARWLALRG